MLLSFFSQPGDVFGQVVEVVGAGIASLAAQVVRVGVLGVLTLGYCINDCHSLFLSFVKFEN